MDSSQKQSSSRPRRIRSIPPPDLVEVLALGRGQVSHEEIVRFRDQAASLAGLAAEIRRARQADNEDDSAQLSARLARQLIRRQLELRDAIALAERALARRPDSALAGELCALWVGVGDYVRGASFLLAMGDAAEPQEKAGLFCRAALLSAHGGKVPQALQALHRAMTASPQDPRPHEMLGAMGFWADFPRSEAAAAYMDAAGLHQAAGEGAKAFQCLLRAFEVEPGCRPAAEALSSALRARGRIGAAEEITREHLRHGSAAARAAHHLRRFASLVVGDPASALEASLEAELDLELDPSALDAALGGAGAGPPSFEAFLVRLASEDVLGDPAVFARLLRALLDLHVFDWGSGEVARLKGRFEQRLGAAPEAVSEAGDLRELRQQLSQQLEPQNEAALRLQVARLEVARGEFREAFEAIEPLLAPERQAEGALDVEAALLCSVVSGRSRERKGRARALFALGNRLPDAAAAVVCSVASEALLEEGLIGEAKDAAVRAVHSDPGSARALAAQALVALSHPEESSDGELETSLSALVARGAACQMLSRSALAQKAPQLALTWAHRHVLLRPADPLAVHELLARAREAGDAAKLLSELDYVTQQPLPFVEISEDIALTLRALSELSRDHALQAARLVISRAGIRYLDCREALEELAEGLPSAELAVELAERLLVVSPATERAALLLRIAQLRASFGDEVGAARAYRRAVAAGADPTACSEGLVGLGDALPPDALLARLEAQAELSPLSESAEARAAALFTLGVARWDMAQDTAGAIAAWLRASELDSEFGLERVAHYVSVVAGADESPAYLERAARSTEDPRRQGKLLGLSARAMLDNRLPGEAFRLAEEALEKAPRLTEVLTVAERAASTDELERLEALYERLAGAALGQYGERAVHYRAARLLERRGRLEAALVHAAHAFEAVPAEGVAYVLMARLADRVGDPTRALEALQRVADKTSSSSERSRWLEKAASLASLARGGSHQRVEILLRAVRVRPEASTIEALEEALVELRGAEPVAANELAGRVEALALEAIEHTTGAHGAGVCLALAVCAARFLGAPALSASCFLRSVQCNLEVPEYGKLVPFAEAIAGQEAEVNEILAAVERTRGEPGALLGRPLAELLATICQFQGRGDLRAEVLCHAACDGPEDAELLELARIAAEQAGRGDLLQAISDLLPPSEQVKVALLRVGSLSPEEGIGALLELDLLSVDDGLRRQALGELAVRFEQTERLRDAADAWREILDIDKTSPLALSGLERVSGRLEDYDELVSVLKLRQEATDDPSLVRELSLRRARILDQELGRAGEARAILEQQLASGVDLEALGLLASSHEKSGDDERAAELWLLGEQATDDAEQKALLARRAAGAFYRAGEERRALLLFDQLAQLSRSERELQLELARRVGDQRVELRSLLALAQLEPPGLASSLHLDAARLALTLGESEEAERLAQLAGHEGPHAAEARLLACQLKLQRRPLTKRDEALEILQLLEGTEDVAGATQREIRAYLLAEALDLTEGAPTARATLEEAIERQGRRPLLCVGLARLISPESELALELYEEAMGGDFHGLRGEGDVLLGAAMAARLCGKLGRARAFASAVSDTDTCHADAVKLLEEIVSDEAQRAREEKARREAEEKARLEAEERARQEEEERQRREAEEKARREAEEKARREAEERARQEEEERQRREAEEKARLEAEERARQEEEERQRREAEVQARREAEEKARLEAEERARQEEEERQRREAEEKARLEAEERARQEEEERQRREAEVQARLEAEEKARLEAEERARQEEEERQRREAEERRRLQAEERARLEAEERARQEEEERQRREAEEKARLEAEEKARLQAEERARQEEEERQRLEAEERARLEAARSESRAAEAERARSAEAERERLRLERDQVLRLAREEAARERAAVSVEPHRRSSVPPEALGKPRSSRPPLLVSADDTAPHVEVSDGAEEVSAAELREVAELSAEEEARAVVPPVLSERPGLQSERAEEELVRALEKGEIDAGLELLDRLAHDRSRSHDAVIVAGHLAALRPGEGAMLGRLVAQASRDGNEALALAVRHVLGSFGAGDQVVAPPLARVMDQPDAVRSVLWRGLRAPVVEALHLVWENGSSFFKRDLTLYGIVGTDRVSPSSPTVLAELYRESSRILGMGRTPLFRVGGGADIAMRVALLSPPAVLITGDVGAITAELSFHFGAALAASTSETALIFGTEADELTDLLHALAVSFGGTGTARSGQFPGVTKLASFLWEAVPARAQRRLGQLCSDPRLLTRELATDFATFALRRAGMIVCGDVRTAIADACQHDGLVLPRNLSELAHACEKSPAVADLLTLAISPEYAELRFRMTR